MRIRFGYDMTYQTQRPTPMVGMLNVHYSRAGQLKSQDFLTTEPQVPISTYHDSFGNFCFRLVAPGGDISLPCRCGDPRCRRPRPGQPERHPARDRGSA